MWYCISMQQIVNYRLGGRVREEIGREVVPFVQAPELSNISPGYRFDSPEYVNFKQLFADGIRHILVDYDGTLAAGPGDYIHRPSVNAMATALETYPFRSLHIATDSYASLGRVAASIGDNVRVFQPYDRDTCQASPGKRTQEFWKRVLRDIECVESQQQVVMIGDSPITDIQVPGSLGIQTALVNRLYFRTTIVRETH